MRRRAIADLSQLSDDALFETISEGLGHIIDNAEMLIADANLLCDNKRGRGFRILEGIAEEECAKFLILLDAIRCPRQPAERFSRQLRRFNDHLTKGIYANCCMYRPRTLGELVEYIGSDCETLYLDGPNDVDWMFDNEVLRRRETTMYVDYVENEGEHTWWLPAEDPAPWRIGDFKPVCRIVRALWSVGVSSPQALKVIAEVWRAREMGLETTWTELRGLNRATLEALEGKGLLSAQPSTRYGMVVDEWTFPLYSIAIDLVKVDPNDLREARERQYQWLWY